MLRVFVVFLCFFIVPPAFSQSEAFRSTPYPLPRFVSTGDETVYVRTGPGRQFPLKWVYQRSGIPVEIILEYEHWRKIRDFDGDIGWVHKSLLSGGRTAFIAFDADVAMYESRSINSDLSAILKPSIVVEVARCNANMCKVEVQNISGWVLQKQLWGVYEGEKFD